LSLEDYGRTFEIDASLLSDAPEVSVVSEPTSLPRSAVYVCCCCEQRATIFYRAGAGPREVQELEFDGLKGWLAIRGNVLCAACVEEIRGPARECAYCAAKAKAEGKMGYACAGHTFP
jgi:hypothetical protein